MNLAARSKRWRQTRTGISPTVLALALLLSASACQTALRHATTSDAVTHIVRSSWSEPVEPFQVAGNIYYVGTSGISSHLIVTDDGLILMDAGTNPMPAIIQKNVEQLGYRVTDIKVILSSHAHWDHVEGLAQMKRLSGARVVALGEDATAIADGLDNSALGGTGWEPVAIDRKIKDGDTVSLGSTTLTAHHTPGHTKGCTTWTTRVEEDGEMYDVVFIGGTSVNLGVDLHENERHPDIARDYARTFRFLKSIHPDILLAQHPGIYRMEEKREAQIRKPRPNPFINPDEYPAFITEQEKNYRDRLNN